MKTKCPCSRCAPYGTLQLPRTKWNHVRKDASRLAASTTLSQPFSREPSGSQAPELSCKPQSTCSNQYGGDDMYYGINDTDIDDNLGTGMEYPPRPLSATSSISLDLDQAPHIPTTPNVIGGTNGEDEEEAVEEQILVEGDMLFRSNEGNDDEEASVEGEEFAGGWPPAFWEDPVLRNVYISVFNQAAFHGATHIQSEHSLKSHRNSIISMLRRAPVLQDDIDIEHMALTLRTVEKRLGVDPDESIVFYILCSKCWKPYHPTLLYQFEGPACSHSDCVGGLLYTTKDLPNRKTPKRIPCRVLPYYPIVSALQNLLLRPGFYESLQHWRGPGDHEMTFPMSREEWFESRNPSEPLKDVYDGWMWRSLKTGVIRKWDPLLRKVKEEGNAYRFVSLPCGIVFHINVDWCVPSSTQDSLSKRSNTGFKAKSGDAIQVVGYFYASITFLDIYAFSKRIQFLL